MPGLNESPLDGINEAFQEYHSVAHEGTLLHPNESVAEMKLLTSQSADNLAYTCRNVISGNMVTDYGTFSVRDEYGNDFVGDTMTSFASRALQATIDEDIRV